uniref:DUF834 domain-containing protein n=1 Tax=Oryza nivara TaxID=4536 RepID=A0A0E0HTW7_ORYNI
MVNEGAAAATKDEGGVCRQPCGQGQRRWRQTRTATQWSATAAMADGSDRRGQRLNGVRRAAGGGGSDDDEQGWLRAAVMTDEGGDLVERETMMAI